MVLIEFLFYRIFLFQNRISLIVATLEGVLFLWQELNGFNPRFSIFLVDCS